MVEKNLVKNFTSVSERGKIKFCLVGWMKEKWTDRQR